MKLHEFQNSYETYDTFVEDKIKIKFNTEEI